MLVEVHNLSQLDEDLALAHLIDKAENSRDRKSVRFYDEILGRIVAREFVSRIGLLVNQQPGQPLEYFSN